MLSFVYIIIFCALFVNQSETARILAMFPVASISHQVVFRPLTQELARRGHDVTVITPDPAFSKDKAPANLTEIDVHDISYESWNNIFLDTRKDSKGDVNFAIKKIYEAITAIVDAQFQDERVRNIIDDKTKRFDLILVEAMVRPTLVLSHIFKTPLIQISSFGGVIDTYENMGASIHPFLYPALTRQRMNNLTVLEKIKELYNYYQIQKIYRNNEVNENKVLRKNFGDQVPTIAELKNNVDMLFININPIFEGIRPVPPSVIYMGGLHQKPNKDLPAELQSYLDSSKNGVIYISFGSNVDPTLLPADRIEVLVKTLSQLPYDILWKWNGDVLPGRTDNIRIEKWLPQQDLLRHPNIKLFITQAGLQSTDEAISGRVPMIAFPMFADQPFNAERYEFFKIGIKLNLDKLTVEQFTDTIKTVIEDKSYKNNVEKLRSVMHDQPQPLERAVWWTEHVLRHGGARHLRGPAANMSWAEYLELELVFTLLLGLLAVISVLFVILRSLYKMVFGSTVTSTVTSKPKKAKRS